MSEQAKARQEACCNASETEYFGARSQIDTLMQRHSFCAGFYRGYAAAISAARAQADSVLEDATRPFPAILDGLLWLCVKEHGTIKPLDGATILPIPRSWKSSMLDAARKQGANHD